MKKTLRFNFIIFFLIILAGINWSADQYSKQMSYEPVNIPDPGIQGFIFPTSSERINTWVYGDEKDSIYRHGWGLWTAINLKSDQVYYGDTLRIWETWYSIEEIIEMVKNGNLDERTRPPIQIPRQILKFKHLMLEHPDDTIFESVKFSPASANYVLNNRLLLESKMDSMLTLGEKLNFPPASMNIKPVFKIISDYNVDENGLFAFKAWTGPPAGDTIKFPQRDWMACVYVDTTNNGMGDGSVDYTCENPQPENTYNLNDFVYYRIDEGNAEFLNNEYGFKCDPGDFAILVGMHMTTAEIDRWTWETFWWTPDPQNPVFPSLPGIVGQRPPQLQGAAAHYTMAVAYQMVQPVQPEYGGESVGEVLYAYNPYLETVFGDSVLNNNNWDFARVVSPGGDTIVNKVGIRTNCMSCHAQANWGQGGEQTNRLGYIGDAYVDMATSNPNWDNVIQADFAWSVVDNVIKDISGYEEYHPDLQAMKIYPNPSNGLFKLETKGDLSIEDIRIYSVKGNLCKSVLRNSGKGTFNINIKGAPQGVYLIKAGNAMAKIILF